MPRIAPACIRCALPLEGVEGLTCGHCQKRPPAFDRTVAAFAYRFPLNQLIPLIKYQGQTGQLGWLADSLADHLQQRCDDWPQVLVPVPLAAPRLRRRGYNQAALLATRLAKRLELATDLGSLSKPRETAHQMELRGKARRRNLRGAFQWNGPTYTHVALIDDVMTTGTTVNEISRLLKSAGIRRVDIWVLARTPAPGEH
ncbi:ComF family protein [Marinobacterium rhizophilum]|uniref:ComF family protein n=2 Tax=Marinobacterium rhizophilum TaxID=420402 RepID=A0ABY5HP35_9GAMM|nr:ComF family protein [Marinobacterium rhizophilum]